MDNSYLNMIYGLVLYLKEVIDLCIDKWFWYLLAALILLKLVDKIIRIPRLGKLSEKYILVTGCDSGFGNELAKRLDSLGCNVFAGCLTETGETELKKSCSTRLVTLSLNVTSSESIRKAYEFVKSRLPPGIGLWGLVNNAGVAGKVGRIEWLTLNDYKDTNAVNIYGMIDMTTTFLPLIKQSKGRIVNTSSLAGRISVGRTVAYTLSKYAVEAFTDCLRRQMKAYGVKCSIVEPGMYLTSLTNPTNFAPRMEATWEGLDSNIKEEFGKDYVKEMVEDFKKTSSSIISTKTYEVVDAYEHALLARLPRARYLVGPSANFHFRPLIWMPESLSDFLIEKFLVKFPVPASIKKQL